jgi:DNA topoisomerase I
MASRTSGKTLIIVESPAKAKTIGQFLGSDFRVESSYGHIRDLPQSASEIPATVRKKPWARLGVNVDEGFDPLYVIPADKKKHVDRLKEALKTSDRLLLATDEDREGESISWHILEVLKPKRETVIERIVFHEVTPEAIQEALRSPRQLDENLVRAQEARRVLDRLYGYSLSPLLWKRVGPGLSAGRVQSVAVRLLVERERARMVFVRSEYWDLKARVRAEAGDFEVRLNKVGAKRVADGRCFDPLTGTLADVNRLQLLESSALELAVAARASKKWRVGDLERAPFKQRPAPPFTTSTLQQEGNRKLRLSARRTMDIAQQLYEGIDLAGERVGLITYMRTDSLNLAERALDQARQVIRAAYGADYLPATPIQYKTKAKRAQEAHEAIRPTDLSRRPQDVRRFLNDEQARLYELIWKRTIACQMLPADLERTSVSVAVTTPVHGDLELTASGRRIVFPGYLRAYVEGTDDPEAELGDQETLLPALEIGQPLDALDVTPEGHSTKPPYRYTEASLVKELEEEGIGRPSTYASIISTIQDRGYVAKKGNELIPTFTAFCVTSLLERQFADLVDPRFTASMEDELDEIAEGKLAWGGLLKKFYLGDDRPGLNQRVAESEVIYPSLEIGRDPQTDQLIEVKIGKYGAYLKRGEGGAENLISLPESLAPDELTVEVALQLLQQKKTGAREPLAQDPLTGRGIFVQTGRFGDYLELEQNEDEKASGEKPRRVSLPRELKANDVTPEIAALLIRLPRSLGKAPDGAEISTNIGRFGPYVKKGDEFRSLPGWREACEIDLADALAVLDSPKPPRRGAGAVKTVLVELGSLPGAAGAVRVLDGRYGPYVSDGETHATLPKGQDPLGVTPELAQSLLEQKRAAPSTKKKAGNRKAAPAKKAAKPAKAAAKTGRKPGKSPKSKKQGS